MVAALLAGCAQTPERPPPAVAEAPMAPAPSSAPAPVAADVAEPVASLRSEEPLRYVVKKGDTLWDIAAYFLQEPWQWPEIWYVNDQVRNPHLIYPGDVLTLIWRDGRPLVMAEAPLRSDRLVPQVREIPLDDAIPTIPLDAIRDFLRSPRVVDARLIDRAPYVLGFSEPHLMEGAGKEIYVKNLEASALDSYDAVRVGKRYLDPVSGDLLGHEAVPVADLRVVRYGDPATVLIKRSYRETRPGDRLIEPFAENFDSNFYPHAPASDIDAYIISVFDGVSQIGQYHVVTLNLGERDGLEVGHVLSVMQTGRRVRDPYSGRMEPLPEVLAGTVMVFRVEQRVSYALVMDATREIHVLDRARTPEAAGRR